MPDTLTDLCDQIEQADSKSSIFQHADAELRRELIDALIKRKPYTYRAVFDHYELAGLGISFTAFYYWARRVRRTAALVEMSRTCGGDGEPDPFTTVSRVIAQRLLDASLDEDIGIEIIDRLSRSYYMINRVEYLRRRLALPFGDAKSSPDSPPANPDLETLEKLTRLYTAAARTLLPAPPKSDPHKPEPSAPLGPRQKEDAS